ncbi:hypothetical protein LCGC14_0411880 [marine sediment metagenome]|uniref:Uncharacterized protein n=1 Tax=marine sediment metagenome TaxID=412755 RepID=A0A0F9VFM1_9ZZZZ
MSQVVAYDQTPTDLPVGELLDWLLFSCTARYPSSTLRVFWDLDDAVSSITKQLSDDARRTLSQPPHRIRLGSYRLYYIPSKVFSIGKSGEEANFFSLDQYFPEDLKPRSLSELQRKADLLMTALSDLGIPSPTTLSSPVACFKASGLLDEHQSAIPTIFDAPESHLEAYEIALQCTPREWVANYQIGHWAEGDLWSTDIASAYPFHASQLIDLRDCSFSRSNIMDETAYYGFLEGDFTVYPDHPLAFCSPFLTDRGDGTLVNFTGTVPNYPCLLDEVRILYRHGLGEFRLKSGWFVKPLNGVRPNVPLNVLMTQLYDRRGGHQGMSNEMSNLVSYIVKRVMTGIIGKLLEAYKDDDGNITKYGDLYNPIYHALVTTRTRLQVFDFLVQNEITRDELVHIGVDGVRATRYIHLPDQAPMGRWRSADSQPTFVLSPGAIITPYRNFKRTGYVDLLVECLTHPMAYQLGNDPSNPIDLHKLFLNQTRSFGVLPVTGERLLNMRCTSYPVEL